ncbi:MAG: alpha-L-fucosidase, partial [Clostridia bacterium]|nr:alpha-L-fucosidase [Clostridia bacterium]
PAYPAYQHHSHPHRDDPAYKERRPFSEYLEYMHSQVRELASKYGKLDIMWFDYSYGDMRGEKWEATKLIRMLKSYQPDIITDNRLEASGEGFGSLVTDHPTEYCGDFVSPECIIPPEGICDANGNPIPWEACITMNDHWGYCSTDFNYKTGKVVVRKLVECVSKGGNLLLNVGPEATGRFPDRSIEVLSEVGKWMKKNSDAIYGGDRCGLPKPEWGRYIQKGNTVYAMVIDPPVGPLALLGISEQSIKSLRLLADGSELKPFHDWRTANYSDVSYVNLPDYRMYDDVYTVLKIELK